MAVRKIGPYAIEALPIGALYIPPVIKSPDSVIVADCPNLRSIAVPPTTSVTSRIYENCPLLDGQSLNPATPYSETEIFRPIRPPEWGKPSTCPRD